MIFLFIFFFFVLFLFCGARGAVIMLRVDHITRKIKCVSFTLHDSLIYFSFCFLWLRVKLVLHIGNRVGQNNNNIDPEETNSFNSVLGENKGRHIK